jgi:hypothetical protein
VDGIDPKTGPRFGMHSNSTIFMDYHRKLIKILSQDDTIANLVNNMPEKLEQLEKFMGLNSFILGNQVGSHFQLRMSSYLFLANLLVIMVDVYIIFR